ncbi:MAG: tetratricopeptide repeat protein, partial [Kiritimatiellae bacterium]|nr:tetratricopeptide repeat protein [Kiritimatiellia bacterium]
PVGDLYACSVRYGYLLSAQPFARKRLWMYTGIVRDAENAARRQADRGRLERTTRLARLVRGTHCDDPETFLPAQMHFRKLVRAGDVAETLLRLARLAVAAGDTDEAADYLAVAAARGAGKDELALDQALLDYARGDTAKALAGLKRLTRVAYNDLRPWLALATIAPAGSRTYRAAMAEVDRRKHDATGLLAAAANLRMVHGENEAAREDVNRWLEIAPHALDAWELLIDLDDRDQDGARLDEHLNLLLRFAPDHPYRFIGIGNEALSLGDWEHAEEAFRRALQDGRLPTLLVRLGQVLLLRGGETRLEEALALADEVLAKIPDHADGRLLRARVLAELGRWEEAAEEAEAFLAFQPENAAGRLVRARCRFAAGDLRGAGEEIRFLSPRKAQLEKRDVRTLRLLKAALLEKVEALRAARGLPPPRRAAAAN